MIIFNSRVTDFQSVVVIVSIPRQTYFPTLHLDWLQFLAFVPIQESKQRTWDEVSEKFLVDYRAENFSRAEKYMYFDLCAIETSEHLQFWIDCNEGFEKLHQIHKCTLSRDKDRRARAGVPNWV